MTDDTSTGDVSCPVTDAGPGCVDDLHRDVHRDPGRHRRRVGRQHRDRDSTGRRRPTSPTTTVTVAADQSPALTLDKTRRPPATVRRRSATTIAYSFLVTNTGNVTLDRPSPSPTTNVDAAPVCAGTDPGPAATTTCTASYT